MPPHAAAPDAAALSSWIGRTETRSDRLDAARSSALRAALGQAQVAAGDPLPLLHHWLAFWDVRPPGELGEDGHPARGGFMPPIALPRRMWAGGRLSFHRTPRLGDALTRVTTLRKIAEKAGRSGPLVFVTLEHAYQSDDGLVLVEEQDIVYRDQAASAPPPAADAEPPPPADWRETLTPDPVLLFRYSALTLNSHRIHYDRPYATQVEAYPDLVVHGPLQATLMLDLAVRHGGRPIASFDFRGVAAALQGRPLTVCGRTDDEGADLWTEQDGGRRMVGRATWGPPA